MTFWRTNSLNYRLWFGYVISLNARWQFCDSLLLNICWQFWWPLIALTETIELVAFVGLGGVNNVFSHVSLILVATFSIFAKLLLTKFLALVHRTCAPMFLEQNAWVSQKQDAHGNLVVASLPLTFPFSAFCKKHLLWTSVGLNMTHTFLSHKNPQADTFLR